MVDHTVLATALGVIVSVASTLFVAWRAWYRFKAKVKAIKEFMITLDAALEDDAVTEAEFRELWRKFKEIIG
jgi:hypothetical protein